MKVIFLDFDGVLNSAASFMLTSKRRKGLTKEEKLELPPVNEHLDPICAHNFQYLLSRTPDTKIVISSTWREIFDLEWLKKHLFSYGIDSTNVIDKTPALRWAERGFEIGAWLKDHPEVTQFVVIDDNHIGNSEVTEGKVVSTNWYIGLTLLDVLKALEILGEDDSMKGIPL